MKIRLSRSDVYWLEDILLSVYNGLPQDNLEGSPKLETLINKIQDTVYTEDISDAV